ncbi:hypothetical protein DMENIID0001_163590 [Sergentomyia squamirostris]
MIAIFYAVLYILVVPVSSLPVSSARVADVNRKTLNLQNAAVTIREHRNEGWLNDTKPSDVATNFLSNLVQNNNAVQLAFEGQRPDGNYANLSDTPILDYAFMKPENTSEAPVPNWQDTLANIYKNPAFQNGSLVRLPPVKIVGAGTESKFPLIVEIFAQRIQSMFSNYVHEDLSRPVTWDKNQTTTTTIKPSTRKTTTTTKKTTTVLTRKTTISTRNPYTWHPTRPSISITTSKPTHTTTKHLSLFASQDQAEDSQSSLPSSSEELSSSTETNNDSYIYVGDGEGEEFDRKMSSRRPRNKV